MHDASDGLTLQLFRSFYSRRRERTPACSASEGYSFAGKVAGIP
jgi:hypothetical protein